jgi:hypothetical protein
MNDKAPFPFFMTFPSIEWQTNNIANEHELIPALKPD